MRWWLNCGPGSVWNTLRLLPGALRCHRGVILWKRHEIAHLGLLSVLILCELAADSEKERRSNLCVIKKWIGSKAVIHTISECEIVSLPSAT